MLYFRAFLCAKIEKINMELSKECMKTVTRCLADAKIDKRSKVHDVVLVGGS